MLAAIHYLAVLSARRFIHKTIPSYSQNEVARISGNSTALEFNHQIARGLLFSNLLFGGCVVRVLFGAVLASSLALVGCIPGARPPLNPVALVGDDQTDLAIRMFLATSIALAQEYGFDPDMAFAERLIDPEGKSLRNRIPFLVTIREDVPYSISPRGINLDRLGISETDATKRKKLEDDKMTRVKILTRAYIQHGSEAAQIICRNYMFNLSERNRYYEFLQKELNVVFGLAQMTLALSGANLALTQIFAGTQAAVTQGLDIYQEFRYLAVDHEAARVLVLQAQKKLTNYYIVNGKKDDKVVQAPVNDPDYPMTFIGAINAVAEVEYLCTRSGLKYLLNKTVTTAPAELTVTEGIITFGKGK